MDDNFKTKVIGGYDKKSVYAYIDMLKVRKFKLEGFKKSGSTAEDAYEIGELKYPEEVLKKAAMGGFDDKQVDEYIEKFTNDIKELERELKIRY